MRATRWLMGGVVLALVTAVAVTRTNGEKTVSQRVAQYGAAVDQRLAPVFASRNIPYPPTRLALIGFKGERELEVWATDKDGTYRFVKSYPILAASGKPGPKLRQGDGQVPEGIYRIELLNPNSLYHLSLRVSYPNDFDRQQAERDGRSDPGGDIMIHGGAGSSGCLAMGDEAAEELSAVPSRDVGLVLGTSRKTPDGRWSNPHFVHRIEAAAALYKAGKVKRLLVSGDNH